MRYWSSSARARALPGVEPRLLASELLLLELIGTVVPVADLGFESLLDSLRRAVDAVEGAPPDLLEVGRAAVPIAYSVASRSGSSREPLH